jgi:hypothetical protein
MSESRAAENERREETLEEFFGVEEGADAPGAAPETGAEGDMVSPRALPLPRGISEAEYQAMSRRRFLTGAVVGGAAGLAATAGTGAVVWRVADRQAEEARQAALDELDLVREAAAAEVARLEGLVDLYENLEKIGLDAILQTGMAAVALPLEAVEAGVRALKAGLEWAEEALLSVAAALPTARESLRWLEDRVEGLAAGITSVEETVGQALDRATDNAVGEALEDLTGWILDHLPFGLGDRIRGVLSAIVVLITSVDSLVADINTRLLEPLEQRWFSTEEDEGLGALLLEPLVERVLDPLEAHLGDLAVLTDKWQAELRAPAERALAERAQVRAEIDRYRRAHGFEIQ